MGFGMRGLGVVRAGVGSSTREQRVSLGESALRGGVGAVSCADSKVHNLCRGGSHATSFEKDGGVVHFIRVVGAKSLSGLRRWTFTVSQRTYLSPRFSSNLLLVLDAWLEARGNHCAGRILLVVDG